MSLAGVTFKGKCNKCHDVGHKKANCPKGKDKEGGSSNNNSDGSNKDNNNNSGGGDNHGTLSGNSNGKTKQFAHATNLTNATTGDIKLPIAETRQLIMLLCSQPQKR